MRVAVELETYERPLGEPSMRVIVSTDSPHSRFVRLQVGDGPVVYVVAGELIEAARRACLT